LTLKAQILWTTIKHDTGPCISSNNQIYKNMHSSDDLHVYIKIAVHSKSKCDHTSKPQKKEY
jgi:hypothetical protein